MIDDLKPYPAMKDSSVPWLGEVPDHWVVQRLGTSIRGCITGIWGSEPNGQQDLPCVRVADFDRMRWRVRITNPTLRAITPSERSRRLLNKGDLLLEKSGGGEMQPVGVVMRYDHDVEAVCSNFVARMPVADGFDSAYLAYLHSHLYAVRLNVRSIKQTTGIQNLDSSSYLSEPVAFPPLPEQAAIVRFLDQADRRIRRYIRAKQKLIKLLEEQKQAIIHRAVTRGLDPDVRLKPSGVEWLGEVPEHWSLKRFKFLARVTSGQVDPRLPEYRSKILVAPNHIGSGAGRITHQKTAEEQGADSGKYEVREGQIIYSKIRPNLRKAAIATIDCICSADMYPITVRESDLRPAYMLQLLLSAPFTKYAVDCSLRVAMPKVNREALGECWFWYPSLEEQDTILEFVERTSSPADLATGQAQREIDLLREYRTRLIADVVTGKLDVREAAARLPDELDDDAALESDEELLDTEDADGEELAAELEEVEA